jgi:RNA polymerase sigma factor (sigma-70 family)
MPRSFEEIVPPHLDAAYNYAWWPTKMMPTLRTWCRTRTCVRCYEPSDDRADASLDPEAQMIQLQTVEQVQRALDTLPADFREVLVLRELEGLSYTAIAAIVGIPIGTAMSRLARGRERHSQTPERTTESDRFAQAKHPRTQQIDSSPQAPCICLEPSG